MELNREQIIKALECCSNNDECVGEACPYYATGCEKNMPKDALSIIKELTIELEAMRGTANYYKRLSVDLAKQVGSLKDELAKRPEPLVITKIPKKKK